MKCNICGEHLRVLDAANYPNLQATRRRRFCVNEHRITTIEIPISNERMHTKTVIRYLLPRMELMSAHEAAISMLESTVKLLRKGIHG